LGNIAELEFLLIATKRGLVVSRPTIQSTIYDFVVDNGKRILKVQIKSTFSNGPAYGLNIGKGSTGKTNYSPDDIDIIACFIGELGTWYFFPIKVIGERVKITVFPNSIESKWNKYREGWVTLLN
jgi:hypothetical protein